MLDQHAQFDPMLWNPPCEQQKPARTLGESSIARWAKSKVFDLAQSPFGKRIERVLSSANWDAVLLVLIIVASFMAGMAAAGYVIFGRILLEACR